MANNYLEFSEVLDHLTEEERRWLEEQLETVVVFDGHEYSDSHLPVDLSEGDADWTGLRVLRDLPDEEDGYEAGFEFSFYDDPENGQYLWLCTDEGGDPSHVGHLVQKFLRQFRREQCWSLTYATTCSKPRIGEFSGGALFVTADSVELIDAHDIVEQRRDAFHRRAIGPNNAEEIPK